MNTPAEFLNQASPGAVGIREKLESSGVSNIVCSLMHTYSNHINEHLIDEIATLKTKLAASTLQRLAPQSQLQEAKWVKLPTDEDIEQMSLQGRDQRFIDPINQSGWIEGAKAMRDTFLSNQKPEGGKCETCRCNPCSSACPITEPNN